MAKRAKLYAVSPLNIETILTEQPGQTVTKKLVRPPSREGKKVLTLYLDPIAWRQLRRLAVDEDTSLQALGEQALNLLFTAHGLNRSA